MSDSIEWTHTSAGFRLIGPTEEVGGFCPDDEESNEGNVGFVMGQCCLYGQPADLLEMLSRMKQAVISHLIDQAQEAGEQASEDSAPDAFEESTEQVPF